MTYHGTFSITQYLFKMNSIKIYNNHEEGIKWLNHYGGCRPIFTCTLGFTDTALIEGISAAGATPNPVVIQP